MSYRPWGPLEWALSLGSQKHWSFFGAIGTEERSLTSWELLKGLGSVADEYFVEVHDADSEKYRDQNRRALQERREKFRASGGNVSLIEVMPLMAELYCIEKFVSQIESTEKSIVLDITSLPKRFFFLILRKLMANPSVENLLITYTSPAGYAPNDEALYEDIEKWKTLPGFGGSRGVQPEWVVSIGFLVESLRVHVGSISSERMKLLIPFPAPLAALQRTWASVANLEADLKEGRFEQFRVEPLDMSSAFDRIVQIGGVDSKPLAFAPFGPKPTSAAMCLYALQKKSAVHYAQPTVYHPQYSIGVRSNDPAKAVNAYWVKHERENLYDL